MLYWLKVAIIAVGLGLDAMSVCDRHRRALARAGAEVPPGLAHGDVPIRHARRRLAGRFAIGRAVAGRQFLPGRGAGLRHRRKMLYEALKQYPGEVEEHAEHVVEHAMHLHRATRRAAAPADALAGHQSRCPGGRLLPRRAGRADLGGEHGHRPGRRRDGTGGHGDRQADGAGIRPVRRDHCAAVLMLLGLSFLWF